MSSERARATVTGTDVPTRRSAIVVPLLALLLLFLAALGYPAVRVLLADELPVVETTEIAASEPRDDALILDPEQVHAEVPELAKALDLALESGELTLVDHETSRLIRDWFHTTYGLETEGLPVRWHDAFFEITIGAL